MKEFKVGDKVYDLLLGRGVVTKITEHAIRPINVTFQEQVVSTRCTYTKLGYTSDNHIRARLYHADDLHIEIKPIQYEYKLALMSEESSGTVSNEYYLDYDEYVNRHGSRFFIAGEAIQLTKRERVTKCVV